MSLSSDLPEAGLSLSHQTSTTSACTRARGRGYWEGSRPMGHSPRQHGVQQNAQAPDVAAFVVALALKHLAGRPAGEHGQSEGQWQVAPYAC